MRDFQNLLNLRISSENLLIQVILNRANAFKKTERYGDNES